VGTYILSLNSVFRVDILTVIPNFNNIFTYHTLQIPPAQAQCSVFCLNAYVRPDDG
jgi:hypothetical protein